MYQFCQELAGDTLRLQASGRGLSWGCLSRPPTLQTAASWVLLPGLRTRLASLREWPARWRSVDGRIPASQRRIWDLFYGIHLPKTMKFHMFWDDLHWPAWPSTFYSQNYFRPQNNSLNHVVICSRLRVFGWKCQTASLQKGLGR